LLPFSVRLQTTALRHGGGHQALYPGLGPLQIRDRAARLLRRALLRRS
jgi:hypothetical protein